MTKQKHSWQTWWRLSVLALIMIGSLILTHRLAPSPGWRTFLEVGVVVVGYGLMTWCLETDPAALLDQPPAEADGSAFESPQMELPAPLSSRIRRQFYAGSTLIIIYGGSEPPTGHLRLNGHHHLAKTTSSLSKEATE